MGESSKTRPSADPTRQKILSVAQQLFAVKGFAGTSINDIASKAKINQSLIYHHFGNKQALWRLVKENLLDHYFCMNDISLAGWFGSDTFREFVRHYIRTRFQFFDSNPDVQRMINWQRLEPKQNELRGIKRADVDQLCEKIRGFQENGEVADDCDPELILVLLTTTATSLFSNVWGIFDDKPPQLIEELKEQYLELIVNTVERGLCTPQTE